MRAAADGLRENRRNQRCENPARLYRRRGLTGNGYRRRPILERARGARRRVRAAYSRPIAVSRRAAGKDRRIYRVTVGRPFDPAAYGNFLREIGYLIPEPPNFTVRTENVLEIARVAGPQLVVPASRATPSMRRTRAGAVFTMRSMARTRFSRPMARRAGRATTRCGAPRSSTGSAHFSTTWFPLKNRILLEHYYLPGDLEAKIDAFVEFYLVTSKNIPSARPANQIRE